MIYDFKGIQPVPPAKDFVDIILSKTQRRTPTVIHPSYKIIRIRQFYMRKIKFTQDSINEKLDHIIEGFPRLDGIHPFYGDLLNVLYDRDHYKLALGQMAAVKRLVDAISRDYVRLMKFADSLYRCKQLKRAALGRMVTLLLKQKDSLGYLEQVRMHLSRLPTIDPYTRTLIICGYPNVGKSSFINKITNANVEVQPYAFTTKSLYVGHFDYRYLRWQVIDTPGILDHPFEERNTIEMLSITALAHLQSCILYFMDLSEQCGYSIDAQCKLFHSIKPLFSNKSVLLVINKTDLRNMDDLNPSERELINDILKIPDIELVSLSCITDTNIIEVKSRACDILLADRVDKKLKSTKIDSIKNLLHISNPIKHDDVERPPVVPPAHIKYDKNDSNRPKLEKELEKENGGCGVYNVDLRKNYILANDEWKHDPIPEFIDGKNVADLIDVDIEKKLIALEEEEEKLYATGYYDILDKKIPKLKYREPTIHIGPKPVANVNKIKSNASKGSLAASKDKTPAKDKTCDEMDVSDDPYAVSKKIIRKTDPDEQTKVLIRALKSQKDAVKLNRSQSTKKPTFKFTRASKDRHLISGKRKLGKTDRR